MNNLYTQLFNIFFKKELFFKFKLIFLYSLFFYGLYRKQYKYTIEGNLKKKQFLKFINNLKKK